ncbi:DUF6615 family protein [Priestia megaterium]|uniref:DUF6615 family protein n=1 Tax=Priestia megaterium TaxID=1404 RepID=UPI001ADED512|nr:DUF6615 family protein [Priestia megaterium]
METAKELEIDIQEETLTELMLIDLKLQVKKFGLNTTVIHANKNVEADTGADFLWFIGSKKTGRFTAFYIQAKRYINKKYKLKHTYKKPKHGTIHDQVKNLTYTAENAVGFKAIPIYCFYNLLEEKTLNNSTYLKKFPKLNVKKERFSFTYTCAYHVESLLELVHQKRKDGTIIYRSKFSFEEVKGLPIHTLFCPKSIEKTKFSGVYRNFQTSHATLFLGHNNGLRYLVDPATYTMNELPSYIKTLIRDNSSAQDDVNEDIEEGNENENKIDARYVIVSYEDENVDENYQDKL